MVLSVAPRPILHDRRRVSFQGKELYPAIDFRFSARWKSAVAYAIFLLATNLAAPCLLFYVLREHTEIDEKTLIGVSSAVLGVSSSFDAPYRVCCTACLDPPFKMASKCWKLIKHRDYYGPIGSKHWYTFE
jgi:hypothetical protein